MRSIEHREVKFLLALLYFPLGIWLNSSGYLTILLNRAIHVQIKMVVLSYLGFFVSKETLSE